jgi:hypothetical protein
LSNNRNLSIVVDSSTDFRDFSITRSMQKGIVMRDLS